MSLIGLIGWMLLSFADAAIGGAAARPGAWYASINKPAWNPPDRVFGPVWTVLYTMMGVAAWLVWSRRGETPIRMALTLFGAQLVLNTLWSWLFFGWHLPGALLIPYLAWVGCASVLNGALWWLNR